MIIGCSLLLSNIIANQFLSLFIFVVLLGNFSTMLNVIGCFLQRLLISTKHIPANISDYVELINGSRAEATISAIVQLCLKLAMITSIFITSYLLNNQPFVYLWKYSISINQTQLFMILIACSSLSILIKFADPLFSHSQCLKMEYMIELLKGRKH